MLKCTECIELGRISKLYLDEKELNPIAVVKYYDESGLFHVHSSRIQTIYYCSNGHRKVEIKEESCPTCSKVKESTKYTSLPSEEPKKTSPVVPTGVTTDRNHPGLGWGSDETPVPQNEVYLVLSKEERDKGFVRPLRRSYKHVGIRPKYDLRDLTEEEKERYKEYKYIKYEEYPKPNPDGSSIVGRYWTEKDLRSGCGAVTTMGLALCETYARNPRFYSATYCCNCAMHRPVAEFIWTEDGAVVGS